VSIDCLSDWNEFGESGIENRSKIELFSREKITKTCSFAGRAKRTVCYRKCTDRARLPGPCAFACAKLH